MANNIPGGTQGLLSPIYAGGKLAGNVSAVSHTDSEDIPFQAIFQDALQNVQALDEVKNADSLSLAVGDADDLASLMLNAERAQTAFQLAVEMRNKLLEGYNEVMRISI